MVILCLLWVILPSKQPVRLELIVEKGKQTYADKKANRKLAFDYAKAGYGWAKIAELNSKYSEVSDTFIRDTKRLATLSISITSTAGTDDTNR